MAVVPNMKTHCTEEDNLRKIIENKNKEIIDLQTKNKKLQNEKSELERRLYPAAIANYAKPKFITEVDLKMNYKKETRPIFIMTILHNKLYVVLEECSEIIVYDSVTFQPEPRWPISEMSKPLDIASCSTNNYLYICNRTSDKENLILRADPTKKLWTGWSVGEDESPFCSLSVARDANVVVSLFNGNKIKEYSPDGQLIREIRLSPADNISHPWHAIKTTSMHFIFSHGIGDDPLQRVCVAKDDGKIIKSFGGRKGTEIDKQHMNRPVHLLEDSSRNVLVAEMKNGRVLLLSPTLESKGILLSKENGKLRFPMRLCLDEERGILFVADNNYKEKKGTYDNGRIFIFNCKK